MFLYFEALSRYEANFVRLPHGILRRWALKKISFREYFSCTLKDPGARL